MLRIRISIFHALSQAVSSTLMWRQQILSQAGVYFYQIRLRIVIFSITFINLTFFAFADYTGDPPPPLCLNYSYLIQHVKRLLLTSSFYNFLVPLSLLQQDLRTNYNHMFVLEFFRYLNLV